MDRIKPNRSHKYATRVASSMDVESSLTCAPKSIDQLHDTVQVNRHADRLEDCPPALQPASTLRKAR